MLHLSKLFNRSSVSLKATLANKLLSWNRSSMSIFSSRALSYLSFFLKWYTCLFYTCLFSFQIPHRRYFPKTPTYLAISQGLGPDLTGAEVASSPEQIFTPGVAAGVCFKKGRQTTLIVSRRSLHLFQPFKRSNADFFSGGRSKSRWKTEILVVQSEFVLCQGTQEVGANSVVI